MVFTPYLVYIDESSGEKAVGVHDLAINGIRMAVSESQLGMYQSIAQLCLDERISIEAAIISEFQFALNGWTWVDKPQDQFVSTREHLMSELLGK